AAAAAAERDVLRQTVGEEQAKRAANATEVMMLKNRLDELEGADAESRRLGSELAGLRATLEAREAAFVAEVARTTERFEALAGKALEGAQKAFLERAQARFTEQATTSEASLKQLLQPVAETLKKYETRLGEVEAVRAESYGQLKQQLEQVVLGQAAVSGAAAKLETALRSSGKVAGRWGEEQCRNVLEAAGLVEGIDFEAQFSVDGEEGNRQRPDFKLMLPGDRALIIDVKCSIDSYVSAAEADDPEARAVFLRAHARAGRTHADGLAKKDYAKAIGNAVEFVVLFVPGENFLGAALEQDRALMNDFFKRQVVLAGPVNLVAVARTVAALRDQARLAKEAAEIAKLGRDLYDSIRIMGNNFAAVQKSLESTVGNWNKLVNQAESRVVSRARRFRDLGAATGLDEIGELGQVASLPTLPSGAELKALPAADAAE
ncbi:DNA recombination protein RmuC, partial [Polymorphobacter multimanifer]|uniref:DNA recombination protein RmuC n=1 Tax=Polymorphobacter multimanifer TaxID=1070431 RepID=UPI00166ECAA2